MSGRVGWGGLLVLFSVTGLAAQSGDREYRTKDCAFQCPASFKVFVANQGRTIQLRPQSRAAYWSDTITIRKQNKKTNECDIPQDCQPDKNDNRKISGHSAFAYSGEDAAMNRYVKTKGYVVETRSSCWRFELIRKGKPFQKYDLPAGETKKLETQSERDLKKAEDAFKTVLDSFAFVGRQEAD